MDWICFQVIAVTDSTSDMDTNLYYKTVFQKYEESLKMIAEQAECHGWYHCYKPKPYTGLEVDD